MQLPPPLKVEADSATLFVAAEMVGEYIGLDLSVVQTRIEKGRPIRHGKIRLTPAEVDVLSQYLSTISLRNRGFSSFSPTTLEGHEEPGER
jgi:hypothetical protein